MEKRLKKCPFCIELRKENAKLEEALRETARRLDYNEDYPILVEYIKGVLNG